MQIGLEWQVKTKLANAKTFVISTSTADPGKKQLFFDLQFQTQHGYISREINQRQRLVKKENNALG